MEYENRYKSVIEVLEIVVDKLEKRVKEEKKKAEADKPDNDGFFNGKFPNILEKYEGKEDIDKDEYKDRLIRLQKEMRDVQYTLYEKKIPLILVYEGWDAAGKGGNIKRVVQQLDPQDTKSILQLRHLTLKSSIIISGGSGTLCPKQDTSASMIAPGMEG